MACRHALAASLRCQGRASLRPPAQGASRCRRRGSAGSGRAPYANERSIGRLRGPLDAAELGQGAARNGIALRRAQPVPSIAEMRGAVLTRFLDQVTSNLVITNRDRFASVSNGRLCAGVDYPALAEGDQDFVLFWRTLPWDHAPGALVLSGERGVACRLDGTPYRPTQNTEGLLAAASHEYERLKATLYNAARHGPSSQNRDDHPDYRSRLVRPRRGVGSSRHGRQWCRPRSSGARGPNNRHMRLTASREPKAKSSFATPGRRGGAPTWGDAGQAATGGVRMVVPSSLVVIFQPRDRSSASLRRARCSGVWRRS
jgi:hypothetical protein